MKIIKKRIKLVRKLSYSYPSMIGIFAPKVTAGEIANGLIFYSVKTSKFKCACITCVYVY